MDHNCKIMDMKFITWKGVGVHILDMDCPY